MLSRALSALLVFTSLIGCRDGVAQKVEPPANTPAKVEAPVAPSGATAPAAEPMGEGGLPVDLSGLRDDQKATFGKLLKQMPSACGKPHSLEVSVKTDPKCKRSVFAARYIVRLIKAQLLGSEIEEKYEERFGAVPTYTIDIKDAPIRGEASAPVTIIEFSDFQCPICRSMAPILEKILDEYRGQVRVVFKNYPLTRLHANAEGAAMAAVAAGKQNKFWPFHDRMYKDQEHLSPPDLEKIAKDLKLDVKKWKSDIEPARASVQKDQADGEKLEIRGTPTLFINGRRYRGPNQYEDIKDWVEEELNK